MDVKLCSFNCKGFNVSKIKHITELLSVCDILMLQETWLLKSQIGSLNQYFTQHNACGVYERKCVVNRSTVWRLLFSL